MLQEESLKNKNRSKYNIANMPDIQTQQNSYCNSFFFLFSLDSMPISTKKKKKKHLSSLHLAYNLGLLLFALSGNFYCFIQLNQSIHDPHTTFPSNYLLCICANILNLRLFKFYIGIEVSLKREKKQVNPKSSTKSSLIHMVCNIIHWKLVTGSNTNGIVITDRRVNIQQKLTKNEYLDTFTVSKESFKHAKGD